METRNLEPGRDLLNKVRGALISRGTNLSAWCAKHGLRFTNARAYLLGIRNGPVARLWRQRLIEAALGEKQ